MIEKLHIFTKEGNTYTFKNIEELETNESVINFSYRAMSDGKLKVGTFFVKNIAGFSTTVQEVIIFNPTPIETGKDIIN